MKAAKMVAQKVRPSFSFSIVFIFLIFSAGCHLSETRLLERADQEAANQRAPLAKYLYLRVLESHSAIDDLRFRAMKGLADVERTQMFDYASVLKIYERLLEDYRNDSAHQKDLDEIRILAAQISRINLQDHARAEAFLGPWMSTPRDQLSVEILQEIGKLFTAERRFEEAETYLKSGWRREMPGGRCEKLKSLQLDLMQNFSLSGRCGSAVAFADSMPPRCDSDRLSVALEKAHCYEVIGEPAKAMRIYEEMARDHPENSRPHFLMEHLKRRQKEKAVQ